MLALAFGFLGVIGFPFAAVLVAGGRVTVGLALGLVAACSLGLALWVARRSRGDDGGDPVAEVPPGPDGPVDWADFDRERERWERTRRL